MWNPYAAYACDERSIYRLHARLGATDAIEMLHSGVETLCIVTTTTTSQIQDTVSFPSEFFRSSSERFGFISPIALFQFQSFALLFTNRCV